MATVPASEAVLRTFLARNLNLVDPALKLIEEEHRLSNPHGTGGRIDILARDAGAGDLVVIELKRSNQTEREALQELEKYVALLASDRGVRLDQLRCILLSTHWDELKVPFTRFLAHVDFYVVGLRLLVGEDGLPVGTQAVDLPVLDAGLEVCPLHTIALYAEEQARDVAYTRVTAAIEDLNIADYVTFELDLANEDSDVIYNHGFGVALAVLSEPMRDHIRARFPEACEDEPSDEWWHEQVAQMRIVEAAQADEVRIFTPSDVGAITSWDVRGFRGYGRYGNDAVWSETELAKVVFAEGEALSPTLRRTVVVANKPAWKRLRRNVAIAIEGCGTWPATISALLDELETRPEASVSVQIYAPADILRVLEAIVRLGDPEYLPRLLIEWTDGREHGIVGGILGWDGVTHVATAQDTLGVVFYDFMQYISASTMGGIRNYEVELTALHGLSYDVAESVERADGSASLARISLVDGALCRDELDVDRHDASGFLLAHQLYLQDLATVFANNVMRAR